MIDLTPHLEVAASAADVRSTFALNGLHVLSLMQHETASIQRSEKPAAWLLFRGYDPSRSVFVRFKTTLPHEVAVVVGALGAPISDEAWAAIQKAGTPNSARLPNRTMLPPKMSSGASRA